MGSRVSGSSRVPASNVRAPGSLLACGGAPAERGCSGQRAGRACGRANKVSDVRLDMHLAHVHRRTARRLPVCGIRDLSVHIPRPSAAACRVHGAAASVMLSRSLVSSLHRSPDALSCTRYLCRPHLKDAGDMIRVALGVLKVVPRGQCLHL